MQAFAKQIHERNGGQTKAHRQQANSQFRIAKNFHPKMQQNKIERGIIFKTKIGEHPADIHRRKVYGKCFVKPKTASIGEDEKAQEQTEEDDTE